MLVAIAPAMGAKITPSGMRVGSLPDAARLKLVWPSGRARSLRRHLPVHRHHGGSAQAYVVLKRNLGAFDLALLRHPAKLPVELAALSEAGGSQWMTLRDESA